MALSANSHTIEIQPQSESQKGVIRSGQISSRLSYLSSISGCRGTFNPLSFQLDAAGPKRACQSLYLVAAAVAAQGNGQSLVVSCLIPTTQCVYLPDPQPSSLPLAGSPLCWLECPVLPTRIIPTLVEPPQSRIQGLAIISFFPFPRLRFLSDVLAYPKLNKGLFFL